MDAGDDGYGYGNSERVYRARNSICDYVITCTTNST